MTLLLALLLGRIPRPLTRDRARIDANIGARDHARVVRRQKYRGLAIVAGTRQLLHRYAFPKRLESIPELIAATANLAAPSRCPLDRLRRIGRRRRKTVDANPVPDQFHRGRSREVQQPALAGAVRDIVRLALMPRRRNYIDDGALAALLDHRLRNMLGEQERAAENYLELTPPLVQRHLDHALLVEDGRVVHQDVDSAERLARRRDRRDHLTLVGDVARHCYRPSADALDVARTVGAILRARIPAHERGPPCRKASRHPAADIRTGPRYQRNFSAQLHLIQRGGGAVKKHFDELKIHVSMNSVSAGLRFSSASTPARHIQFRISCCPLASTDAAG